MITLDRSNIKNKWFEYDEDVSFLIRPFPISEQALSPSSYNILEVLLKQALYCLIDWKGIVDVNNKPIKCNEENKQFMIDYSEDLMTFINTKAKEMTAGVIKLPSKKT